MPSIPTLYWTTLTAIASTWPCQIRSSQSPLVFLVQLTTSDRHFRQAGSLGLIFFIARADKNTQNKLCSKPKTALSLIGFSHPTHVIQCVLGILTYRGSIQVITNDQMLEKLLVYTQRQRKHRDQSWWYSISIAVRSRFDLLQTKRRYSILPQIEVQRHLITNRMKHVSDDISMIEVWQHSPQIAWDTVHRCSLKTSFFIETYLKHTNQLLNHWKSLPDAMWIE
jgi:hypothetical protein